MHHRQAVPKFKVAGVIYWIETIDGHHVADDLGDAAEALGLPGFGIDIGELAIPNLTRGGSIDDVPDVAAAMETIQEAVRSVPSKL